MIECVLINNNEKDVENLKISEIAKLDIEIKERLKNRNRYMRINRISHLTSTIGIIYALLGLLLILVSSLERVFFNEPMVLIAVIFVFVGFIISILGLMLKIVPKNKHTQKEKYTNYDILVINKWKVVESIITQITPRNETLSLKSMIRHLEQNGQISEYDCRVLDRLLFCRNSIIHNTSTKKIHAEEIKDLIADVDIIINKLSGLLE